MISANVLIVDDDRDVLETARMFLKQEISSVQIQEDPSQLPSILSNQEFDVILLDMNFKKGVNDGDEGFYWLDQIQKLAPQTVVILITAYGEVDLAVRAIKNGATDFVLKPWKNQKLLGTVLASLQLRKSRKEIERLKNTGEKLLEEINNPFTDFIGTSPPIARVRELIERVAPTDANILILGENGTGKELVARSIHQHSLRKNNALINVDLGSLTESLFESELFGHVKGAFTDAKHDKVGLFEMADNSTLFLDEIGNLSLPQQSKLLTVLQNRHVQRVGSAAKIPINFRLISATNADVHEMVNQNKFRQDLLYRINTVEIRVPSLRERKEDIPLLLDYFLGRYANKYKRPVLKVEKSVLTKIMQYPWPGNIRELQHAVERAVILTEGNKISNVNLLIGGGPVERSGHQQKPTTLDEMEKQFIQQSIQANDGNVSKTAKALGMTRTALYRRMRKHKI